MKLETWLIDETGNLQKGYVSEIKKVNAEQNTFNIKVFKKVLGIQTKKAYELFIKKDNILENIVRYKNKLVLIIPLQNYELKIYKNVNARFDAQELSDLIDATIATATTLLTLRYLRYFFFMLILHLITLCVCIINLFV